ncbi:MAG: hypothetical protein ACREK6_00295 [Candidatus Rokuibacteriota bacterium]
MRVILDPHRRQRLLRRTIPIAVLAGGIALAGSAEWLRWFSHQRVADAHQALKRLAVARESVLLARGDQMRRQLNRPAFRAWAAALATLTASDRPVLRGYLERGNWKVELETTSSESARHFAAALGAPATLGPRKVSDGFGWAVTMDIPEDTWIGWPSQESPSGS